VATVKVPEHIGFGFEPAEADIVFPSGLDHLNFRELPAGSELGRVRAGLVGPLEVSDEHGADVGHRIFDWRDGRLRLRKRLMPAMLTKDAQVIRQDCLCYLMERLPYRGGIDSADVCNGSQSCHKP